ncbi:MAG: class D sortase [Clostridiales Family XIII bacterium]|jgi:LPXTG-site transpeptidase (sortase) family protein|nr:class D sortase [Clostridiales Family XIII bacterium]
MKSIATAIIVCLLAFTCAAEGVFAADYTFSAKNKDDFYKSTLYEDLYGSEYNYGGPNVTDFADTAALLPGILSAASGPASAFATTPYLSYYETSAPHTPASWGESAVTVTPYTSASELMRADGSIGTLEIPSLSLSVKIYEGTGAESLGKGAGHFPDSSAWFGNVCIAGHNRGAKHNIGSIKNLRIGDIITYSTDFGTRRYAVTFSGSIPDTDMSRLSATPDNRITLITCLADRPSIRICVQAAETQSVEFD